MKRDIENTFGVKCSQHLSSDYNRISKKLKCTDTFLYHIYYRDNFYFIDDSCNAFDHINNRLYKANSLAALKTKIDLL